MLRFIVVLSVVTALIMLVVTQGLDIQPTWYYETISFLYVSTAGLYFFLVRTKQHQPDNFVQSYLLTLVVKLLVYGAYVFTIVLIDEEGAFVNAGFFMITYIIFTALEIGFLYRRVNQGSAHQ